MHGLEAFTIPGFDAASGMVILPWWAVATVIILLIALLVLTVLRIDLVAFIALGLRIAIVLLIVFAAWLWMDRTAQRDRADERRALESRFSQLGARAVMPGSPLGCLDGIAGDTVEIPCEKTLFANPETVAAATSYAAARLALLADAVDYANRMNRSYEAIVPGLSHALENDRFGFTAQVLATREGCTPEKCEAFAMFRDPSRIRANLKERSFNEIVARNSGAWTATTPKSPAMAAAPLPTVAAPLPSASGASPVPPGFVLPSPASIPPVSIMTPEPGSTGASPAEPTTSRSSRRPPRLPQRRPQQASPPPPVQISPPTTMSGTPPPVAQ